MFPPLARTVRWPRRADDSLGLPLPRGRLREFCLRVVWVALALLGGLGQPVPAQSDAELVELFDRADAARDHEQALAAARTILQRHPDSATWNFHAARALAMLGQGDEAMACLQRSAAAGFTGVASLEQHQDLNALRERDDFRAVLETVRGHAGRRLLAFQEAARAHTPPSHVPDDLRARLAPGEKPALVIALHGTGGTGREMIAALRGVCDALGVICVAPDALRPAGDGFAWTYRDESQWLVTHTATEAIREHDADPRRVLLLGFSQGANIALAMARTGYAPFTALVPVCGHYEPDATAAEIVPPPMYLVSGALDPWSGTFAEAERDVAEADVPVVHRVIPDMGHALPGGDELVRALQWAQRQGGDAPR